MKFETLLAIVGDTPLFDSGLLLAGARSPAYIRRQMSGWVETGKIWQLRRGLYMLAPPHQKTKPHPFVVANRMVAGSYVSLQSALAYFGLIPEYVPVTTSVTTRRPGEWDTPVGLYTYRHIQPAMFFGYEKQIVADGQSAVVATPEKALLDLIYLQPGGDAPAFLESLRLQNVEQLKPQLMKEIAAHLGRPKLDRAVKELLALIAATEEYETL